MLHYEIHVEATIQTQGKAAKDIERFGADGITVHPRPDERHIRYQDVFDLKKIISTEFNIEGNPTEAKFVDLVLANMPTQKLHWFRMLWDNLPVISGWDTVKHAAYLKEIITVFKNAGIRYPFLLNPDGNGYCSKRYRLRPN